MEMRFITRLLIALELWVLSSLAQEFPLKWCTDFGAMCDKYGNYATCNFSHPIFGSQSDLCCSIVQKYCNQSGSGENIVRFKIDFLGSAESDNEEFDDIAASTVIKNLTKSVSEQSRETAEMPKWCRHYPKLCKGYEPREVQPKETPSISKHKPIREASTEIIIATTPSADTLRRIVRSKNSRTRKRKSRKGRTRTKSKNERKKKKKELKLTEIAKMERKKLARFCKIFKRNCKNHGHSATCTITQGKRSKEGDCCKMSKAVCKMKAAKKGKSSKSNKDDLSKYYKSAAKKKNDKGPYSEGKNQDCFDLKKFRKQALKRSNKYRRLHSAKPLKASKKLDRKAQGWAEKWIGKVSRSKNLYLPPHSGPGENIYVSLDSEKFANRNGGDAVDAWQEEVNNYDWKNPGKSKNGGMIGHFTQLVWRETKRVGHGFAASPDCRHFLVVANYAPGGNLQILNRADLTKRIYKDNVRPSSKTN